MKKVLILVLCALLGVSMMFSLVACDNNNPDPTPTPQREEKTLMVGDSLFDLWKDYCATDLAGAKNLVNIAIGGTSSIYWQKSEKIIKRENPTTIIMCLGTNDIADLGRKGECAAQGGDEFDTCLQGVLEMFHRVIPDAYIYYLTINVPGESIRWNKRAEIAICNQLMREYCADKDWVEIIDMEHAFYDNDDYLQKPNAEYFISDYLHFSRKGYQVLTGLVRQGIGLDEKVAKAVEPAKTLLIGDSHFDFWNNWTDNLSGLKYAFNIGIGGTTAADWIKTVSRSVAINPDKLIISIGANDIVSKNGKNCAEDNTGIQKMLELYHEKLPNTQIYLLTISICGEPTRWNKRDQIAICNELMKTYAVDKDWLTIVDVEKAFYDGTDYTQKPEAKYFWSQDYLHYTESGYARLCEYLRPALGLSAK